MKKTERKAVITLIGKSANTRIAPKKPPKTTKTGVLKNTPTRIITLTSKNKKTSVSNMSVAIIGVSPLFPSHVKGTKSFSILRSM